MSDKIQYNSDLKKLCRTCLSPLAAEEKISIFKDFLVAKHLSEITKVQFVHHSALSAELCPKCHQNLKTAIDFRDQVQNIELQFKKIAKLLNEASQIPYVEVVDLVDSDNSTQNNVEKNTKGTNTEPLQTLDLNIREIIVEKSPIHESIINTDTLEDLHNLQDKSDNEMNLENASSQEDIVNLMTESDTENVENGENIENTISQEVIEDDPPIPKKSFACLYCDRLFIFHSSCIEHEKVVHSSGQMIERKKFECSICGDEFSRRGMYRSHLKKKHRNIRPFACKICKSMYYTKHDLAQHMAVHRTERPYMCDLCPKTFSASRNLLNHKMVHKKAYQCELCGLKLSTNANLNIHKICHTDERNFICDICGKAFKSKTNLMWHKRLHLNPVICTICEKEFTTETCLNIHMKIHTKEKPYKCDVCGKGFQFNGNLKKHKKNHAIGDELQHKTAESS